MKKHECTAYYCFDQAPGEKGCCALQYLGKAGLLKGEAFWLDVYDSEE
ncbi:MAG: hypothetical protein FGF51_08490 [Candidatus Brockarchaeota archaeon]|nr:hypothetical protein [Candidatus Brockarchaeota archaeon]